MSSCTQACTAQPCCSMIIGGGIQLCSTSSEVYVKKNSKAILKRFEAVNQDKKQPLVQLKGAPSVRAISPKTLGQCIIYALTH